MAKGLNGKVVLAASHNGQIVIRQFSSDGSPDNYFGSAGEVSIFNGQDLEVESVAIQPDGRILVGGHIAGVGSFLARFQSNGNLDPTFNGGSAGNGIINYDYQGGTTTVDVEGIYVSFDGTITVAGNQFIQRIQKNGAVNKSFGNQGMVTINGVDLNCVTLQPSDGKIVAAGQTLISSMSPEFAVVRLTVAEIPIFNPGLFGDFHNFVVPIIHFPLSLGNDFDQFVNGLRSRSAFVLESPLAVGVRLAEFDWAIRGNTWTGNRALRIWLDGEKTTHEFRTWLDADTGIELSEHSRLHNDTIQLGGSGIGR
jgi:uncharacterized delta-60 repeat protein